MKIRGVNLGNWLVLEKWMGDSPLSKSEVSQDDHDLVNEYADDPDLLYEKLEAFRSSYVTRDTILWLKEQGCNLVRVPIPYHICGSEHHKSCSKHLNNLFDWCDELGVGILIDLHTVPYSQSGADHSGYMGVCKWHQSKERVDRTIGLLCRLSGRYAGRPSFWGIEPLNEPGTKGHVWSLKRRFANDPIRRRLAYESEPMGRKFLMQFYQDFYHAVRPIVGPDVRIVLHDNFFLPAWNNFMRGPSYENVVIDTHKYPSSRNKELGNGHLDDYIRLVEQYGQDFYDCGKYHEVICGEWCAECKSKDMDGMSDSEKSDWLMRYTNAQIDAWDNSAGGFFWSLQTWWHNEWSFIDCVKNGWIDLHHGI